MTRLCIAVLILVLSGLSSQASALQCPDGLTRAATLSGCAPRQYNTAIDTIGQTSFRMTGYNDAQAIGAKRYDYTSATAYPPGCTSGHYTHANLSSADPAVVAAAKAAKAACTRYDLIISGSGATVHGSETLVYEGQFLRVVSGVTAGNTYYNHSLLVSNGTCDPYPNHTTCTNTNRGKMSLVDTLVVTTGSPDPDPPPSGYQPVNDAGQERYIGTGGNDLSDGLSNANRWLSLSKIGCSLPAGTNVALLNTSVFSLQELELCHAGISSDWVIVGSYKLDGSSVPVWVIDGVSGTGTTDQKAAVVGGLVDASFATGANNFDDAFPIDTYSSEYDAPFKMAGTADYVEVRNVVFKNLRHKAASIGDSYSITLTNVILDGIDFDKVGGNPFALGTRGLIWRNGTLTNSNACKLQHHKSGKTGNTEMCDAEPYGGGIQIIRSEQFLVEKNLVKDNYGECINAFNGAKFGIIRQNTVGRCVAVAVYIDAAEDIVVEQNIIVFKAGEKLNYSDAESFRGGIWTYLESYDGVTIPYPGTIQRQLLRNNLIVGAGAAIDTGLWQLTINVDTGASRLISGYAYGNTVVNSSSFDHALNHFTDPGARTQFWYMTNSAHWSEAIGAGACSWRNRANSVADRNHFHVSQTDTDCNTNITTGNPTLSVGSFATWQAYTIDSPPTFANAKPQAGSALNNSGTPLTSALLTVASYGEAAAQMADVRSGAITLENWAKANYYDCLNVARHATTPDRGACEGP